MLIFACGQARNLQQHSHSSLIHFPVLTTWFFSVLTKKIFSEHIAVEIFQEFIDGSCSVSHWELACIRKGFLDRSFANFQNTVPWHSNVEAPSIGCITGDFCPGRYCWNYSFPTYSCLLFHCSLQEYHVFHYYSPLLFSSLCALLFCKEM